uniref:Uncharacterized protein n=1 Tax=Anguilla anguilla TaxID=7936 RepID=A0A0E9U3Y3_ANGAN
MCTHWFTHSAHSLTSHSLLTLSLAART